MIHLYNNILFQLFLFVVSSGYLMTAISLGAPLAEGRLQPSFFPLIVGGFAVLFSGMLLYREWIAARQQREETATGRGSSAARLIIVAILIYTLTFSAIGYFVPSILFVFAMMLIFSERGKYIQKAVISVVIATLGYLIFELLFGVRLPAMGVSPWSS